MLSGPPITSTTEQKASEILQQQNLSSSLLATGPFTLHTPTLSTYHQQLWVIAVVQTDNTDGKIISSHSHFSAAAKKSFQIYIVGDRIIEISKPKIQVG